MFAIHITFFICEEFKLHACIKERNEKPLSRTARYVTNYYSKVGQNITPLHIK